MNEYKSMYLRDILNIIDQVAVDIMMVPAFSCKLGDEKMSLTEISHHNSMIAMHNEGIREMANMLKDRLIKGDEDDD